jgi:uncharacterized protein (DUF885 family)
MNSSPDAEQQSFDDAVDQFLRQSFEDDPTESSFYGLTEWDDRLADATAAGFEGRDATERKWLERFSRFDASTLSAESQVDLALLLAHLGEQMANADFVPWRHNARTYLRNGVFELFVHGTRSEAEATSAAVARLRQVPDALAAGRANLDPALVDADLLRMWGIPNVAAQAAFMREGLGTFVQDAGHRAELEQAGQAAAAAYDDYAAFLTELAERATGSFVFGEERYDNVLKVGEGFAFGARELREVGRQQVDHIDSLMGELARTIAGTDDWHSVVQGLRAQHPTSMDEMLRCYREETAKSQAFVRDHGLMTVPEGEECAVEPAPLFIRSAAPVASYFPPAAFGPRSQGTFNVPFTPDGASPEEQEERLRTNSFFEIPGVTAHEAYPGHHLHFVTAQGSNPLRQVLTSTYMIEGWGLYVEQMMGEQGYYESPEVRLGQLSMRLFRAGRIVVDTSLHLGEMSMDEATAYMSERCGFPVSTARGEMLRYCANPTQASAYLTGALEIERMAGQWTSTGKGTLRQFHDALAGSGKLPLGVAARAIGLAAG